MKILKSPRRRIRMVLLLSIFIQFALSIQVLVDVTRVQSGLSAWKENADRYILKQNAELTAIEVRERAETFSTNSVLVVEHASEGLSKVLKHYFFWGAVNGVLLLAGLLLIRKQGNE